MWHLLLRTQEVHKQPVLQLLVMTCCMLHNMCVSDRVQFDIAMLDEHTRVYVERYGGFMMDPNYFPDTDRKIATDEKGRT